MSKALNILAKVAPCGPKGDDKAQRKMDRFRCEVQSKELSEMDFWIGC